MTHTNYNTTRILALTAAITVLLTVFAGAAAANTVNEAGVLNETDTNTGDFSTGANITTDSIQGSPGTVSDSINFSITDPEGVNSSDVIQLQLQDAGSNGAPGSDNVDDKDDFKINSVTVENDSVGSATASAKVVQEGPFVGVDDAINVTFDQSASDFSSAEVNISAEITVASQVETKAYTSGVYDKTDILVFDFDQTNTTNELDTTEVGQLSVEPGNPSQFNVDTADFNAYDTKSLVNVTFQDHAGNTINNSVNTGTVDFKLQANGNTLGSVTNQTSHDGDTTDANVTIVNNSNAGGLDAAVGDVQVDVQSNSFSFTESTTPSGEIAVPRVTTGVNATTIDAGNSARINVTLRGDGATTNDQIPDADVVGVNLSLIKANSNLEDPNFVESSDTIPSGANDVVFENASVEDGETTYNLTSTTATTGENRGNAFNLNAEVQDNPADSTSNDVNVDNINVNPLQPDRIGLDDKGSSVGQLTHDSSALTVSVSINDSEGNIVDTSEYYDGSTDIGVVLNDVNKGDRYANITVASASDATQDVTIGTTGTDDIPGRLGVFDITAVQNDVSNFANLEDAESGSAGTPLTDQTIVPDTVEVVQKSGANSGQNITAGSQNLEYSVTLSNGTSGDNVAYNDENVSNVRFYLTTDGTQPDGSVLTPSINLASPAKASSPEAGLLEVDSPTTGADSNVSNITITATEDNVGDQTINAKANESAAGENIQTDLTSGPTDSDRYAVEPGAPTSATVTNVNQSSIGIVHDDKADNVSVTFELRDDNDNFANYDIGTGTTDTDISEFHNVSVADLNGSDYFSLNVSNSSFETDVRDLDSSNAALTVDFDPTAIDNSTTVGQDRNVISVEVDPETTVESAALINISHEAYNLQQGSNRLSLPNDAEVFQNNTDYTTSWNNTESQYDAGDIDLTSPGTEELQKGIFVNASSNGRIAFAYETDAEDVSPNGRFQLKKGWNLVGTNFDISNQSNLPYKLEDDLVDVIPIRDDHNSAPYVYDGQLSSQLDASSDLNTDTNELNPSIGLENDGEYGTYWVKVNSSDNADFEREILTSQYKPSDRDD